MERYSLERAQEVAANMQDKIESGKAKDYTEAESALEHDNMRKEIMSGNVEMPEVVADFFKKLETFPIEEYYELYYARYFKSQKPNQSERESLFQANFGKVTLADGLEIFVKHAVFDYDRGKKIPMTAVQKNHLDLSLAIKKDLPKYRDIRMCDVYGATDDYQVMEYVNKPCLITVRGYLYYLEKFGTHEEAISRYIAKFEGDWQAEEIKKHEKFLEIIGKSKSSKELENEYEILQSYIKSIARDHGCACDTAVSNIFIEDINENGDCKFVLIDQHYVEEDRILQQ